MESLFKAPRYEPPAISRTANRTLQLWLQGYCICFLPQQSVNTAGTATLEVFLDGLSAGVRVGVALDTFIVSMQMSKFWILKQTNTVTPTSTTCEQFRLIYGTATSHCIFALGHAVQGQKFWLIQ